MDNSALVLHKKIKDNLPIGCIVKYFLSKYGRMRFGGKVVRHYVKNGYAVSVKVRDDESGAEFRLPISNVFPVR